VNFARFFGKLLDIFKPFMPSKLCSESPYTSTPQNEIGKTENVSTICKLIDFSVLFYAQ